jgi:excisionase family DNA binding protein
VFAFPRNNLRAAISKCLSLCFSILSPLVIAHHIVFGASASASFAVSAREIDMNGKEQSAILGDAFLNAIRLAVREEIHAAKAQSGGKPQDAGGKPYLTVKEAASKSGLGAATIRLAIRRCQLRAQGVGRRVLIPRSDLESFLGSNPIEPLK